MSRFDWLALASLCVAASGVFAADGAKPRPSLEDLYSDETIPDMAISPSGRYVASILKAGNDYYLTTYDLTNQKRETILRMDKDFAGDKTEASMVAVYWKSDERLLFRTLIGVDEGVTYRGISERTYYTLGSRLFAINRDGSNIVRLLKDNRESALANALNLGSIASWMPHDPNHIVMNVDGQFGTALFRVDLTTGVGEIVEKPSESTLEWWLDVEGRPMVRVQWYSGAFIFQRKDGEGKWQRFLKIRRKDLKNLPDYEAVGPSDQQQKYYVLAKPEGRDKVGLYLYDLAAESFGEPIVENPDYDLMSAQISRDGKDVVRYCYIADVSICEFTNPTVNAHMRGVRRYFSDSVNAYAYDSSNDGKSILFYVEGPSEAPSYYVYSVDAKNIMQLGIERSSLVDKELPTATVVTWTSRDGLELTGYLTRPAGAAEAVSLPLILMPHGGPESRDKLTFDYEVQYFASRGYAVFQPNFRGSEGYGDAFARRGHGEWGRKMQDDLTDGLQALVERGVADPKRVCIVRVSYGGYAALAGAALTPDLYRCAVARAGVSDLEEYLKSRKQKLGADSDTYQYWLDSIGNPKTDAERLAAASPARLAAQIKIPVLLLHGADDEIVPYQQSELMKKALDRAGHPTDLLRFEGEGHSYWSAYDQKAWLIATDRFLWQNLGPGEGMTTPPQEMPKLYPTRH